MKELAPLDMFHDTFVYQSGLGRARGTKNETLALQDPQQVSNPKYESTGLRARLGIGYPNSTNGQHAQYYSTPFR